MSTPTKNSSDQPQSASVEHGQIKTQAHNHITWINIANPNKRSLQQLAEDYDLNPLHLDDSLQSSALPIHELGEKYLYLLIHVPVAPKTQAKIVSRQVAFFLGKDYLITIHHDSLSSLSDLFSRCQQEAAIRDEYFKRSAGYLLYLLMTLLLEDVTTLTKQILQDLDSTEDSVFSPQFSDSKTIAELRQKILRVRRTTEPLKSLMVNLGDSVNKITKDNLAHYYHTISRTTIRLSEFAEEAKETVEIYKDADFTTNTERNNEILAILTILFTLSIPATILGSFYGMNVYVPGGIESGSWHFLGKYTTLIIISAASAMPALIMYIYFKKRNWF